MINFVQDAIRDILIGDVDVVSRLVASRKGFESWLQVETYKRLIRRFPNASISLEQGYPSLLETPSFPNRNRCDLWWEETDSRQSWIEFKTCVTNYEQKFGSKSARPITNQIAEIIGDIQRLKRLPSHHARHLFLLVYPISADGTPSQHWSAHLTRIREVGNDCKEIMAAPVSIEARRACVLVYHIEVTS
jgi:hypothetical protein